MIAGIHSSQEIFTIVVLTALKSSLEQHGKHILRLIWRPGYKGYYNLIKFRKSRSPFIGNYAFQNCIE